MRTRKRNIDISNEELSNKVADLNDLHRDESYPAMLLATKEWHEAIQDEARENNILNSMFHRRKFLAGMGATLVGGAVLAACGTSSSSTSTPVSATPTTAPGLATDLQVATLAASLENLGIYAYKAGISAATAGKLGTVPPAVVTFAQTAMAQHQDHAAAWNSILTGAGQKQVTYTDASLTPTVNSMFAKVTDVTGLAQLALEIEQIAAATYLSSLTELSSAKAIATASSIQPVEMQHAAILYYVLGQYPVPNAFATTSLAAKS